MTVEVAFLLSAVSIAFSIFFGLKNSKRNDAKDIEERTRDRAELNVKLDYIASGMQEIKEQISSLIKDVQNHGVKIAELEQSTKSAHHRLDTLEKKIDEKDD